MILGIAVSKIKSKKELVHLEGYAWKTDKETKAQWDKVSNYDTGVFKVGDICLDLVTSDGDLLGTVTIPNEEYLRIRRQ